MATTKTGKQRYSIHYPKYKAGVHVVKEIPEDATFSELTNLSLSCRPILAVLIKRMAVVILYKYNET